MKKRLRIFVTTSHISTVYITLQARATRQEGDIDVLLVDGGTRRKFLLELLEEVTAFHPWNVFYSFSQAVDSTHDFKPGLRKTFTRKWKGLPLIRGVYNFLLRRVSKKRDGEHSRKIASLLTGLPAAASVEVFLMTQTHIEQALLQLYPDARINYMEHGIGDYLYVQEKMIPGRKFRSVFSHPFNIYLEKTGRAPDFSLPIAGLDYFDSLSQQLIGTHTPLLQLEKIPTISKPVVLVLLEAVDMYNVPVNFWKEYLEHITKQLATPEQYHYLLKTHPIQSGISIEHSETFFRERNYDYTLLSGEKLSSVSIEVLFRKWSDQTQHVFCLFSSGCFYLSQLYTGKNIRFWYSTEFMARYTGNAPPQYKKHFEGLRPIIENVFAEKCTAY